MKPPYVKKWGSLDGFTVFLVDGAWIRKNKDIEFTNADQHFHKKYVPRKEIWVDSSTDKAEVPLMARSAIRESKLMSNGATYAAALTDADKIEKAERKNDPALHEAVKKELLGKIGKIEVWLVRGETVRDKFDIDFDQGGHGRLYPFVPKNNIWLDDDHKASERKYILLHELLEYNRMGQGWKYEKAHHLASSVELRARRNPRLYGRLFGAELKKAGGTTSWQRIGSRGPSSIRAPSKPQPSARA